MTYLSPNSLQARDIASVLHPQTHAGRHLETGPTVMTHGDGIFIHDDEGKPYLDAGAGLWCCSLGYSNKRLGAVAAEAMGKLGYYQIFRHASHGPAIERKSPESPRPIGGARFPLKRLGAAERKPFLLRAVSVAIAGMASCEALEPFLWWGFR